MPRKPRRTATATALACGALSAALLAPAAHADTPTNTTPRGKTAAASKTVTQRAFAEAAREYRVPENVLLALAYLESRWEDHSGRPSTAGGYGPLHLTDTTAAAARGGGMNALEPGKGEDGPPSAGLRAVGGDIPATAPLHTLRTAAGLTGIPAAKLRTDPVANIRGGAALLAEHARRLGGGNLPKDTAGWYPAVARYSGSGTESGARAFADDVWDTLRTGQSRTLPGGARIALPADAAARPDRTGLDRLRLPPGSASAKTECPKVLRCDFVPAAYQQTKPDDKTAYGNYDLADRPRDLKITHIVIHDTETTYDQAISIFTNPLKQVSAHYLMRSGDGHATQMLPNRNVAWQAGNWYLNQHSIGIEQEGVAAAGATWYTEALYRSTARLTAYLSRRHGIPLDRQHIVGHDNVQAPTAAQVRGMHWDPGPYWNWDHFMRLAGAPSRGSFNPRSPLLTVAPDFKRNQQALIDCESGNKPLPEQPVSFVKLRTEPRDDAPLFSDPGVHPDGSAGTDCAQDWGNKASSGQQFAVAERRGDWTAIWWAGGKGWFKNPRKAPTARPTTGWLVKPAPGRDSVPVYGRAYPEASAYEGSPVPVQPVAPLTQYTLKSGQSYAGSGGEIPTDYFYAKTVDGSLPGDRTVTRGKDRYLQIQLGHRIAYVRAEDVTVERVRPWDS